MPPKSSNIVVGVVAVQDPMQNPDAGPQYIRATVNTRTDILEWERSHGRISESAYLTGRAIQDYFEARMMRIRSPQLDSAGRGDPIERQKAQIVRNIELAQQIGAFRDGLRGRIGDMGERFLGYFLRDRVSFNGYASLVHVPGSSAKSVASRFRAMLEELAADRTIGELISGRGIAERIDAIKKKSLVPPR